MICVARTAGFALSAGCPEGEVDGLVEAGCL